ncbi:ParB N-terminal domain-containing protein [Sphingomonas sp. RT2P30]|uniref:ParB/RepB/Spo0J family partition protein n=1 Tax=Parasphingomonas halimpatiens TaxID=3096162 RepID=UPI002FCA4547
MKLQFIPLDKLIVSKSNIRWGRKAPDVSDILPTVRRRGVIQPVLVRPNCAPDGFEIVAGRRRYAAACIVADERRAGGEEVEPLPCAILDAGDDAAAIEASLIENMARLDADEVTQWESFTRLVKEGRTPEDIGLTFGLPDLTVKRVLALGNLLPRIRDLYRRDKVDRVTVRHLTLASKTQQKAWLALADDANAHAPTGHQVKAWLFGGQSIPVGHALFDWQASGLATIADLFGEERYFADSDAFWTAQNEAIEARRLAFIADGWANAVIVPPSEHFHAWEYEKAGRKKGGRVYIDVRANGEVTFHEGLVSRKEAARLAKGDDPASDRKPARAEVTATLQTYIDLHRHAAVRAALCAQPGTALRLMVAHAVAGSHLWRVSVEPQAAPNDAVRESVENSIGEARFDERRRAVLAVLGFDEDAPTVTGGASGEGGVVRLFHRLLDLPDTVVLEVIAVVMGETLASGSAAVDAVGLHVGIDMADWWTADDAVFDLIRDREVLVDVVGEVAGRTIAEANKAEKTKVLKGIVRGHLDGRGGRDKVERWVPRWMAFPPSAYTARGGVGSVAAHARALAAAQPDPGASNDNEPLSDDAAPTAPAPILPAPDRDGEGEGDSDPRPLAS